jgi:hypothetical protein
MIHMFLAIDVHCIDCVSHPGTWEILAPYAAGLGGIAAALIAYSGIVKQIRSGFDTQERTFAEERLRAQAETDRRNVAIRRRIQGLNFAVFGNVAYLLKDSLFDLEGVRATISALSTEIMRPEIADGLTTLQLGNLFDVVSVLDVSHNAFKAYELGAAAKDADIQNIRELARKTAVLLLRVTHDIAETLGDDVIAEQIQQALNEAAGSANDNNSHEQKTLK